MLHPKTYSSLWVLGIAGLLTVTGQAYASGLQISEQSVTGLGRAFAGGSLVNDDVSAVHYNPADMMLSKGMQVQAGFTFIGISIEANDAGSTTRLPANLGDVLTKPGTLPVFVSVPDCRPGGAVRCNDDGGTDNVVPNAFFAMDINDRMRFGLGITAPFAVATNYGRNWVGRYAAVESELKTIDINPGIAYRVTDQLSLGFGVSAQYADVTLTKALFTGGPDGYADTQGDDWGFGFNLGATYEFDSTTRVGLSYRSRVNYTLEGHTSISTYLGNLNPEVTADWTAPDWLALAFYKRLNNQWAVMASTRWTNWSLFEKLQIDRADGSGPLSSVPENWKDSWSFNLGVTYDYNPDWTFRAGYVYDQTPIRSAEYRHPSIPDSDRNAFALGFSYHPSSNLSVDFGYMYISFDDASTDEVLNPAPAPIPAGLVTQRLMLDYNGSGNLVGIQASYKF
ncbi:MAG: TonB-dependent receptor [Candidatus Contendobacter sp.]|nr:TonB-dependent receptor [Candidatus Contendobacter sp.]